MVASDDDVLIDRLIRGSAEINRQHNEIKLITGMLFGLAKHPDLWIRAHVLERKWAAFHTRFGLLADRGAWDVWWDGKSFQTRCSMQNENATSVFCLYKSADEPDALRLAYEDMTGAGGILEARARLGIFVYGMMREFPLNIAVTPFLKAAALAQPAA